MSDEEKPVNLNAYRQRRAAMRPAPVPLKPRPAPDELYTLPIEFDPREVNLTRGVNGEPRITLPGVDVEEGLRFLPSLVPQSILRLAEQILIAARVSQCEACMASVTAEHLMPVRLCEHQQEG